ncbi:hypothetical protein HYS10_02340 [Candidatus Collierbacteria bacterium]|nr:hypothetical protein [Candidatus Collierbacteria bacterium]
MLAQTTASSSATNEEQVKEILKNVVSEKMKSTEESLENEAKLSRLAGYTGIITNIAQNAISLESRKINLQVSIATNAAIIKDGKSIKPEQLSIKDKLIVIGHLNPPDVLAAKRIVVIKDTPSTNIKKVIFSEIKRINLKNKTITINLDNQEISLVLSKKLKLDLETINPGQKIFGVIKIPTNPQETTTLLLGKII